MFISKTLLEAVTKLGFGKGFAVFRTVKSLTSVRLSSGSSKKPSARAFLVERKEDLKRALEKLEMFLQDPGNNGHKIQEDAFQTRATILALQRQCIVMQSVIRTAFDRLDQEKKVPKLEDKAKNDQSSDGADEPGSERERPGRSTP